MTENHLLLQTALAYAKRLGWPVFPLAPGAKIPPQGSRSFKDASTDPERIRRWWSRWPGANIGLACGAAGLVAIDLDVKGGADGLETWCQLVEQLGFDDTTMTSHTPSGGRHLIFRCPPGIQIGNSAGALAPGVDVRGQGGYIVLPPSILRGGHHPGQYAWQRERPGRREPAPLPAKLLALLVPPEQPEQDPLAEHLLPVAESRIYEFRIPHPQEYAYARAALKDELAELAAVPQGGRNDRLNRAAFSLGQLVGAGLLEAGETTANLATVAASIGLEGREIRATIHSGLAAGAREPRRLADLPGKPGTLSPASPAVSARDLRFDGASPSSVGDGQGLPTGDVRQGGSVGERYSEGQNPTEAGQAPPLPQKALGPERVLVPEAARLPQQGRGGTGAGHDWLDAYIAFSRTWSPRSFEGFHEACALWLLSTIAARRVMYYYGGNRYTNLYLLLAGRTTMHAKSTATGIARDLLHACGLDYLLAPDESTPQSFVRTLAGGDLPAGYHDLPAEQQAAVRLSLGFCGQRGWYAEEFGSWLHSMLRTDGHMADFRGILRKLDDCPHDFRRSTISRGVEEVDRPYLALIANLTPADLQPVARRGARLWGDGFLARFAFVTPPPDEVLTGRFPTGQRTLPAALIQPLVEWHQRLGLPKVEIRSGGDGEVTVLIEPPPAQVCRLGREVLDVVHCYNIALLEISKGSELTDLDGNYGRYHEKALRVAALLASLEGKDQVEMVHWARAQAIAERWRAHTHRLYAQVAEAGRSPAAEIEDKILAVLERWQGTEKYPQGMTATEIGRFVHGLGRTEIRTMAEQLVQAQVLAKNRGKRSERYYLPPELKEAES